MLLGDEIPTNLVEDVVEELMEKTSTVRARREVTSRACRKVTSRACRKIHLCQQVQPYSLLFPLRNLVEERIGRGADSGCINWMKAEFRNDESNLTYALYAITFLRSLMVKSGLLFLRYYPAGIQVAVTC